MFIKVKCRIENEVATGKWTIAELDEGNDKTNRRKSEEIEIMNTQEIVLG